MRWRCTKCGTVLDLPDSAFPVSHCGIRHEFPLGIVGSVPTLLRRATNFARAGAQHLLSGSKFVDDATRQWRLGQCISCAQYYDPEKETCTHPRCGCGIKKQRGIIDKLGWASQRCPIGRWDNPPPSPAVSAVLESLRGPSIPREVGWELQPDVIEAHRLLFNEAAESVKSAQSPDGFNGRGIVLLGGSSKYFLCGYILVSLLRKLDCALPIEWWYLDHKEMDLSMMRLAESLGGVTCVNLIHRMDEAGRKPRIIAGWESKVWAIMYSRFKEVLFIDADQVPIRDPSFLFDEPQYLDKGAVFWPDFPPLGWSVTETAFHVAGLPTPDRKARPDWRSPTDFQPFETGQLMVDKSRHWPSLELTAHINDHSDFWFPPSARGHHQWHVYGDKDTFYLAWERLQATYAMPPSSTFAGDNSSGAFLQRDFNGVVLFQHRVQPSTKWSLHGDNKKFSGCVHHETCLEIINHLRELWPGHPYSAKDETPSEQAISLKSRGRKLWFRRDKGQKALQLIPDGACDDSSLHWTVREFAGSPLLIISDWNRALGLMGPDELGNWVNHDTQDFLLEAPDVGFDLPGQPDEMFLWHEIVNCNEYRLPERFEPSDVVIDIGAHCGIFTTACLQRGAGRLISVEPHPDNFERLRNNVRSSFASRAILIPAAAWRCNVSPGHVFIAQHDGARHSGGWSAIGVTAGLSVPTVPFDVIVKLAAPVRLVKLDCEGSEWGILETFHDWQLVEAWCGEYHHATADEATKRLREIFAAGGYQLEVVPNPKAPLLGHFWARR